MTTAWTPQERSRAIQWRNHGRSAEYIAQRLGKPVENVEHVLDLCKRGQAKPKTIRLCLKCQKSFVPRHEGLHLCDPCKASNSALAPCAWPMGNGASLAGRRSK